MEEAEALSEEKFDRPPEPASDAVLTVTRPTKRDLERTVMELGPEITRMIATARGLLPLTQKFRF